MVYALTRNGISPVPASRIIIVIGVRKPLTPIFQKTFAFGIGIYSTGHDSWCFTMMAEKKSPTWRARPIPAHMFANDAVVPNYAQWGGLNDLFLAGPIDLVLRLMDRFDAWRSTKLVAEPLALATFRAHGIPPLKVAIGYSTSCY